MPKHQQYCNVGHFKMDQFIYSEFPAYILSYIIAIPFLHYSALQKMFTVASNPKSNLIQHPLAKLGWALLPPESVYASENLISILIRY